MCSGTSVHEICKLGRKFHLNLCFRVYDPSAKPFSSHLCWLSPYSLYCRRNLYSKVHSKTIQCKRNLATEISPETLSPAFLRDCTQIARRKTALWLILCRCYLFIFSFLSVFLISQFLHTFQQTVFGLWSPGMWDDFGAVRTQRIMGYVRNNAKIWLSLCLSWIHVGSVGKAAFLNSALCGGGKWIASRLVWFIPEVASLGALEFSWMTNHTLRLVGIRSLMLRLSRSSGSLEWRRRVSRTIRKF